MSFQKIPGLKFYRNAEGGGGGGGGEGGGGDAGAAAAAAAAAAAGGGGGEGDKGGAGGEGSQATTFALPEAYKDAAWAKDFKSHDDVFKSLASAQEMIGRPKIGVPGEKATDAEKAEFYKALGVPEKADQYEFKKPDNIPDEMWNAENDAKWAETMRANNVPKNVANALRDAMLTETLDLHTKSTTELNAALDKTFGDKKVEISKEVGEYMKKAIPDAALRAQVEANIGNKNLPAFALATGLLVQHMKKTYGMSDTNTGDAGDGSGGKSLADMRSEATALMASKPYTDTMHKDHKATRAQVDGMYATIGQLTEAAKKAK